MEKKNKEMNLMQENMRRKAWDLLTLIISSTFHSTIKNTEIQTIKLCFDSGSGKLFFVKRFV